MDKSAHLLDQLINFNGMHEFRAGFRNSLKETGRILFEGLAIDRLTIWKYYGGRNRLTRVLEILDDELEYDCRQYELCHESSPDSFEILRSGSTIQLEHEEARKKKLTGPDCSSYPFNSLLVCPFNINGARRGVIMCEAIDRRQFSGIELLFTKAIAESIKVVKGNKAGRNGQDQYGHPRFINTRNKAAEIISELEEKLENRERQISEYAYIHAHEIRGPICRLLGLKELMNHVSSLEEILQLRDLLSSTITEMDEASKKASDMLQK